MNEYRNLLQHYVESILLRRWTIVLMVVFTAGITFLLSLMLLFTAPVYKATTVVSMLPSDPELRYTQGWLGRSQIDPATVGTTTHLEYLYSRPVLETALDYILAEYDFVPPPATGLRGQLREGLKSFKASLWRIYETANYGAFRPISPRDEQINALRSGLTVTPMQASFILRIEAELGTPQLAALAANALAKAYVDFATEESRATTEAVAVSLREQIADRQSQYDVLALEAQKLSALIGDGASSAAILRGLGAERMRMEEVRADLDLLTARIGDLPAGEEAATRTRLEAERLDLARELERMEAGIAGSAARMEGLSGGRDMAVEIDLRMAALSGDIASLRERLLTVQLSNTEALSRVRVIEPARPPMQPDSPKVLVYTLASVFVAAALGGMYVILLDVFNDRVMTGAQMSRLAGQGHLGLLPRRLARLSPRAKPPAALQRVVDRLCAELMRVGGTGPARVHLAGCGTESQVSAVARLLRQGLEARGMRATVSGDGASTATGAPAAVEIVPVAGSLMSAAEMQEAGRQGDAILGIVVRGRFTEAEVERFVGGAREAGARPVCLVMTEDAPYGG